MVFTSSAHQSCQGSGFFISPSGLAISNYHVFKGTTIGYEIIKLQDGRQYKLKDVIFKDKDNDIMVFTIDAGSTSFKYLPLSTRQPRVGDKAYAIGSPRGLENTFSSGEISQLRANHIIQISVPIDHGSSGGALINEYGEAIGITSAGLDDSGANLNFAVSTDLVRKYLK
jgi:serine protease Do